MNLKGLRKKLDDRKYDYQEPEWNAGNINKKPGDTTFKQCGWCEHTGGGSCRYDCHISTSCNLLKEYGLGNHTYWDTPCLIKMLSKKDIESAIGYKDYKIKEYKEMIERTKEEKNVLQNLKPTKKPPLPSNRGDVFDEGKTLWVYSQKENKWRKGIIVPGYRSHDGCVSYILEGVPESKPKPDGDGPWGGGCSIPGIILDWEYQYFKKNLDDFKTWLHLCDTEYNGERYDVMKMFFALTGEK